MPRYGVRSSIEKRRLVLKEKYQEFFRYKRMKREHNLWKSNHVDMENKVL